MARFELAWSQRSDLQKLAFFASILVVIASLTCFVATIVIMKDAAEGGWFSNDTRQRIFFYLMRVFALIFCLLVILAEFVNNIDFIHKWAKGLKFFGVRGVLQVYVGLMTASGDLSPPGSSSSASVVSSIGWFLVGTGSLYLLMSCCCFHEYAEEVRAAENGGEEGVAPQAVVGSTAGAAPNGGVERDAGMMPVDLGGSSNAAGANYRI